MKAAIAIALSVVVLAIVIAATAALLRALLRALWRRWSERRSPWEIVEESDGEQMCVYAARPGDERLLIGAAAFAAQTFESELYELRARGHEKVYALNQRERRRLLGGAKP